MLNQGKEPFVVINTSCSKFVEYLKAELTNTGLWYLQSFDLQSTRAIHEGCTCPNHGTSQCTCELVVLLVYQSGGNPVTLTLDGRDGKTFVFITGETGMPVQSSTVEIIQGAIFQAAYALAA